MERLIDPRTLARVRDLPLLARTVADGFLHGIQASHQRGVGLEFSQYRTYEPGDDPGRIDWKLFARSDRYFVREADRESEIQCWFVLDCSQSMALRSSTGAWSKLDYGRALIATLAWLAQRQGDAMGLMTLGTDHCAVLPPGTGERHWHRLLLALHNARSAERFPASDSLAHYLQRLQQPGLVVFVSDFYQHQDEILDFMNQLSNGRNDLLALQLQCEDEIRFPWRGPVEFEDLETGAKLRVSATAARSGWLSALQEHQAELQRTLARLDVPLNSLNVDEPLDEALVAFLGRRQQRTR